MITLLVMVDRVSMLGNLVLESLQLHLWLDCRYRNRRGERKKASKIQPLLKVGSVLYFCFYQTADHWSRYSNMIGSKTDKLAWKAVVILTLKTSAYH